MMDLLKKSGYHISPKSRCIVIRSHRTAVSSLRFFSMFAGKIARSGAYPSSRILLAVSVQKFPVIVLINQAQIGI